MAKSLAAKSGALQTEFKLPAVFSAPVEAVQARKLAPYIVFCHPKRADEWAKISAKIGRAPDEGDMFLVEPEGITPLPVAKLGWVAHKQFWVKANAAGEVLQVSWQEWPEFKEHVEAVVLVYFDDRVVPANICFRTTKCGAAKALSDALLESQTPAWAEKGPAYRDSTVVNQPFCRFYGTVSIMPPRTSKKSGLTYRATQCAIHPTTTVEWQLQKALSENPDCEAMLNKVADRFTDRVNEMKAKPQPA